MTMGRRCEVFCARESELDRFMDLATDDCKCFKETLQIFCRAFKVKKLTTSCLKVFLSANPSKFFIYLFFIK